MLVHPHCPSIILIRCSLEGVDALFIRRKYEVNQKLVAIASVESNKAGNLYAMGHRLSDAIMR
jgi:hypothetical protein